VLPAAWQRHGGAGAAEVQVLHANPAASINSTPRCTLNPAEPKQHADITLHMLSNTHGTAPVCKCAIGALRADRGGCACVVGEWDGDTADRCFTAALLAGWRLVQVLPGDVVIVSPAGAADSVRWRLQHRPLHHAPVLAACCGELALCQAL
jgi:hypothetical protein